MLDLVKPIFTNSSSFFGFAEFIGALALLVIVYTITTPRYKYRISIAPIPLVPITFAAIFFIGIGTLCIDLIGAKGWEVPKFLSFFYIDEFILGLLFLTVVIFWMYFAFIIPPKYSGANFSKFIKTLYRNILKGNSIELSEITDEISGSAFNIVNYSKTTSARNNESASDRLSSDYNNVHEIAYQILLLIGNKEFCRQMVITSPGTAIAFFRAMTKLKKYDLPIGQFAKNITEVAISNKNTILYHEDDGYYTGLLGYVKPFTTSIYGDFPLNRQLGSFFQSPLDMNYKTVRSWDNEQLEVYVRIVLFSFSKYLESRERTLPNEPFLTRAIKNVVENVNLYSVKNREDFYDSNEYHNLTIAVDFLKGLINLIGKYKQIKPGKIRIRDSNKQFKDYHDIITNHIIEIIFEASTIDKPKGLCWSVQHNMVWDEFFGLGEVDATWKIFRHKVRRKLYDEINRLLVFPNYKSSRILGFCLNVMGLTLHDREKQNDRDYYALKKVVLKFTRKSYLKIYDKNPDVAKTCLPGGLSFDKNNKRLVKKYAKGLHAKAPREYLNLD